MVQRALEKQGRMEEKIVNIEEQLRRRPEIGYERKRLKIEAIRKMANE